MSVVNLARDFASIWSRPVIRAVDTRIFRLRYFRHCMACNFCADQCCNYGVDVDESNVERLLSLGAAFENYVGAPRADWFTQDVVCDAEFPGGRHRRTRAVGGHCIFRAPGRGCRIHAYSLENGLDYHLYKPLVSTLFPLTFEGGVLVPSEEATDGSLICAGEGDTLYAGARDELAYYFGKAFVETLDAIAAEL